MQENTDNPSRCMMLHLIGVDHRVQHDGRALNDVPKLEMLREDFPIFLEVVAREVNATVIAEESSEDVLTAHGATNSIPKCVAEKLNIKHKFCDPNKAKRAELDIPVSEDPQDFGPRENFWLTKLIALKGERILFILGAKHIQCFSERATKVGFRVYVAEEYYGKEYFGGGLRGETGLD